jgi:hypothetical protein
MTRALVVTCVLLVTSCGSDSVTSPTSSSTTVTVAAPTVTDVFSGTLPVSGSRFFSFTTSAYGTINVTLTSVAGEFVPGTVMVGIGIGQPSGTECVTSSSLNTASGSSPQISGPYAAATYCVRIADIGNLFATASFSITVAYP